MPHVEPVFVILPLEWYYLFCYRAYLLLHWNSQIDINPNTGIFVTLNPAGKEYGGRQKLPDNLKLLFRPVVMSEPVRNHMMIISISFFHPKIIFMY